MTILFRLAWRNLWRNRRRSLIILVAIVVGVVSLLFIEGLVNGQLKQLLENQIGTHIGHLQIHAKGFQDDRTIQHLIPDKKRVESALRSLPEVVAYSPRIISFGLVSSASASSGVTMLGVDPLLESRVSMIAHSMTSGEYLAGEPRSIVIGERMAEKLGVEVGDKIVLMASALDGHVGSDAFRVTGLFKTPDSEFDRSYVQVGMESAQSMLGVSDSVSEFAVVLQSADMAAAVKSSVGSALGESYEVFTYGELIPMMIMMIEVTRESMGIYYVIIGLATIFGIINVLLMAVFERIREFGVVMAMGMRSAQVFRLILLEAFLLGVLGAAAGVLVGMLGTCRVEGGQERRRARRREPHHADELAGRLLRRNAPRQRPAAFSRRRGPPRSPRSRP